MNELKFHPAAEIFPLIEGEEFADLVDDIAAHGLLNEIWLHPDGSILDGRNRYRACIEAGVEPRFKTWDGNGFAADFVWSLNDRRRHLDGNQRKLAAARYAIEMEREADERRLANLRQNPMSQICDIGDYGRSTEKAAEKFHESPRTVQSAVRVVKQGAPELVLAVERGEVSVSAAAASGVIELVEDDRGDDGKHRNSGGQIDEGKPLRVSHLLALRGYMPPSYVERS